MARKQIVLRVQTESNTAIRKAAKAAGLSINEYCERRLTGKTPRAQSAKK